MKIKLVWLAAALILLSGMAAAIETDPVSGAWTLTMQTPRGERVTMLTIVRNGTVLTLTHPDRRGVGTVTMAGTIQGDQVEWTQVRPGGMGPQGGMGEMRIVFKGKIAGDAMTGTAALGERGSLTWKAVRGAPPAAH